MSTKLPENYVEARKAVSLGGLMVSSVIATVILLYTARNGISAYNPMMTWASLYAGVNIWSSLAYSDIFIKNRWSEFEGRNMRLAYFFLGTITTPLAAGVLLINAAQLVVKTAKALKTYLSQRL